MSKRKDAKPKILLFAEGVASSSTRGKAPFVELWETLCSSSEKAQFDDIDVHGFTKNSILTLAQESLAELGVKIIGVPLDILIAEAFKEATHAIVVIAFDRIPANQLLPERSCIRSELLFILEKFISNKRLPTSLHQSAERLLKYYKSGGDAAMVPRASGRNNRETIEFLCSDPEFEALIVSHETLLRKAVGFSRRPKDWPWSKDRARKQPKSVFEDVIEISRSHRIAPVSGDYQSNKHGWALHIVKETPAKKGLFLHPIANRLETIFTE